MFSLRQRIFIIISVVLGIIAIVVAGILITARLKSGDGQTTTTTPQTGDSLPVAPNALIQQSGQVPPPNNAVQPTFSDDIPQERLARQIAELFVERFATRSNQNNNEHINSVYPFVTESMWAWVQTQTVAQSDFYVGVRTNVITTSIIDITAQTAAVRVETIQLTEGGDGAGSVQKNGRVELMIDASGTWKVNGFFWDK